MNRNKLVFGLTALIIVVLVINVFLVVFLLKTSPNDVSTATDNITTANNQETENNVVSYPYVAGLQIPVLMYHEVNIEGKTDDANNIPVEKFEKHLQYFRDNGYSTITLKQLDGYLNEQIGIPEKSVVLTFDDGLYSMKTTVLPLLEKYDMHAVTFVIGAYEDERKPGHLNPEEVAEMKASKYVEVASHSYGLHEAGSDGWGKITTDSEDEIIADMNHMRTMLDTNYFCYPFGHFNDAAEAAIAKAGYRLAFTVDHGIVNESSDHFALPRMRVSANMEEPPVE